jgi:hypothetical protein
MTAKGAAFSETGMSTASMRFIVFNAAAGLVAVSALVAAGRTILAPATARPCSERYGNSMSFQLERDGKPLTVTDIQSRVGAHDDGLIENVDVVKPRDPRIPAALRVNLRPAQAATGANAGRGGMSFPWNPRAVQSETAACLSYNVFLHGDLEFQTGGTLPGLRGADRSQQSQDGFAANLVWRSEGQPGVVLSLIHNGEAQRVRAEADNQFITRGRWIKVDQEVILNDPKGADGIVRVWLDGSLVIERSDVSFRTTNDVTIAGVAADVYYGREDAAANAPVDTKIWISPFEMSWK